MNKSHPLVCRRLFLPHQLPSWLITTAVVPPLSAWCRGERKSYLLQCRRGYSSTRSFFPSPDGGNNRKEMSLTALRVCLIQEQNKGMHYSPTPPSRGSMNRQICLQSNATDVSLFTLQTEPMNEALPGSQHLLNHRCMYNATYTVPSEGPETARNCLVLVLSYTKDIWG